MGFAADGVASIGPTQGPTPTQRGVDLLAGGPTTAGAGSPAGSNVGRGEYVTGGWDFNGIGWEFGRTLVAVPEAAGY